MVTLRIRIHNIHYLKKFASNSSAITSTTHMEHTNVAGSFGHSFGSPDARRVVVYYKQLKYHLEQICTYKYIYMLYRVCVCMYIYIHVYVQFQNKLVMDQEASYHDPVVAGPSPSDIFDRSQWLV